MRRGACAVLVFLLLVGAKALCFDDECGTLVQPDDDYPRLELRLEGLTAEKYSEFINKFRQILGRRGEIAFGLPVLRGRGVDVRSKERFVLVDIVTWYAGTATLAIDVADSYIVGYRVGDHSFFTEPDDDNTEHAITNLFVGTTRSIFYFTGSYPSLQGAAGVTRDNIPLGPGALDHSVSEMIRYGRSPTTHHTVPHSVPRGLLVCIQMIPEAARFRYIEVEMRWRIETGEDSVPDTFTLSLENHWSTLSTEIQTSRPFGVFNNLVPLEMGNQVSYYANAVGVVLSYISILKHCDRERAGVFSVISSSRSLATSEPDDPICPSHVQSTWRIVGSDGLCVDVKDGHYNNGNPVVLWPCKSNNDANQLWTFMDDGTLRSNDKCLASYGYTSGDYIMIYDCEPLENKFIWHPWPNGTIVSASGLVLSAHSSASGTELSARDNAYATGQSWLPTNSTAAYVHQIAAAGISCGRYCLHAADYGDVVLGQCAATNMEEEQEAGSWWARYPDGSIRPDQARDLCLAPPETEVDPPSNLKMFGCDPNSSVQRWFFASNGAIVNLGRDLVMEVKGPAAPGAHVTLNARAETGTQEWLALL